MNAIFLRFGILSLSNLSEDQLSLYDNIACNTHFCEAIMMINVQRFGILSLSNLPEDLFLFDEKKPLL